MQVRLDAVDELEPVNMETNEKEQTERPNAVSDQDLHCLLTALEKRKKIPPNTPSNWNWARPSDKGGHVNSTYMLCFVMLYGL